MLGAIACCPSLALDNAPRQRNERLLPGLEGRLNEYEQSLCPVHVGRRKAAEGAGELCPAIKIERWHQM